MRLLITSFLVLFALVELSYWMKHFTLPLPILILGGALLAIASNYGKSTGWSFPEQQGESDGNQVQTSSIQSGVPATNRTNLYPSPSTPAKSPASISFTIRRSISEGGAKNEGN